MSDRLTLYDPHATFDSTIARNAAGVPLLLVATASGNGIGVDYSQVPVTAYDAAEVATIDAVEAQRRMDALVAKYDGVECHRDEGKGAMELDDEDQFTMGADWPLVNALTARGADRVLAHQHLAATKAATKAPAAAGTTQGTATPAAPAVDQPAKPANDPTPGSSASAPAAGTTGAGSATNAVAIPIANHEAAGNVVSRLFEFCDEKGHALLHELRQLLHLS